MHINLSRMTQYTVHVYMYVYYEYSVIHVLYDCMPCQQIPKKKSTFHGQ